jgi:hypothetical protein
MVEKSPLAPAMVVGTMRRMAVDSDDAFRQKVLRDFFDGARLKGIPVKRKKRVVVLEWLAERFEPDRRYGELEVNALLKEHHPDCAALRRELVDAGLLQRESSVYWRTR